MVQEGRCLYGHLPFFYIFINLWEISDRVLTCRNIKTKAVFDRKVYGRVLAAVTI